MPRRRGGAAPARSAPSRPTVAPPARAPAPQQSRQSSTAAHPPATQQAPAQAQGKSPGLFGQMASTAAGVAVGSSIGHAIGGFFGGGSAAPAENTNTAAEPMDQNTYSNAGYSQPQDVPCGGEVKNFTRCMDENAGNMSICGWYLDQLKACQAAARPY